MVFSLSSSCFLPTLFVAVCVGAVHQEGRVGHSACLQGLNLSLLITWGVAFIKLLTSEFQFGQLYDNTTYLAKLLQQLNFKLDVKTTFLQ